jgi:hypothetical protein
MRNFLDSMVVDEFKREFDFIKATNIDSHVKSSALNRVCVCVCRRAYYRDGLSGHIDLRPAAPTDPPLQAWTGDERSKEDIYAYRRPNESWQSIT